MKAKYAIRALCVLAMHYGETLSIKFLAEQANVSQKFLEGIMLELKHHKLVESKRGITGGYFLAKLPEEISVGNIMRYIDGPLAPVRCASVTAYKKCDDCPTTEERCMLHHVMVDARNAIAEVLDNRTLKHMVEDNRIQNEKNNFNYAYYI